MIDDEAKHSRFNSVQHVYIVINFKMLRITFKDISFFFKNLHLDFYLNFGCLILCLFLIHLLSTTNIL